MARKKKQDNIDLDTLVATVDSFSSEELYLSEPEQRLTIGQRIKCIEELDTNITKGLPWEIVRLFPDMSLYGSNLSFCTNGDYVARWEAINGLKLLLKELEGD